MSDQVFTGADWFCCIEQPDPPLTLDSIMEESGRPFERDVCGSDETHLIGLTPEEEAYFHENGWVEVELGSGLCVIVEDY